LFSNWSVLFDQGVGMAGLWVEVPEALWREIEGLVPVPERRFRYPGRRRYPERACLEGILTVLRWGVPWKELPQVPGRPSGKTCWRRFDQWQKAGVWPQLVRRLQQRLEKAGEIDWGRVLLDSTIASAKRGAAKSAETLPIVAVQARSCI
jgi:transposase